MLHTEALLLIDHNEAEIFKCHILGDDAVGSDNDIHTAFIETLDDFLLFVRSAVAAEEFDRHRILAHSFAEILKVLLREHCCRSDDGGLASTRDGFECRSNGDLGFSKSHIAADEAIHRARGFHVRFGFPDRLELVWRFGEEKRALEFLLPVGVGREGVSDRCFPFGLDSQHLGGVLVDALGGFFLRALPAPPSHLRKIWIFSSEANVAGDLPSLIERNIQSRLVCKLQHKHVTAAVGGFFEAFVSSDSVIKMNNKITLFEFRKIHHRARRPHAIAAECCTVGSLACGAAKHLGFGEKCELRFRANEPTCRRRSEKNQFLRIEVEIRSEFAEAFTFTLIGTGEGDSPVVRCPAMELVEKSIPLGFIQDQIASAHVRERGRVEGGELC